MKTEDGKMQVDISREDYAVIDQAMMLLKRSRTDKDTVTDGELLADVCRLHLLARGVHLNTEED